MKEMTIPNTYTPTSNYDDEDLLSDGNCFFADRMLDLEDAQALTTPISVSRKSSKDSAFYASGGNENIQESNTFELLQDARLVLNGDIQFVDRDVHGPGTSTGSRLPVSYSGIDIDADGHAGLYASGAIKGSSLSLTPNMDLNPTLLQQQVEECLRDSQDDNESKNIRVEEMPSQMNRIDYNSKSSFGIEIPSRLPTMPRDAFWGFIALVYIPLSLFLPLYLVHHNPSLRRNEASGAWSEVSFSSSSLSVTFWSTALAFLISTFMW